MAYPVVFDAARTSPNVSLFAGDRGIQNAASAFGSSVVNTFANGGQWYIEYDFGFDGINCTCAAGFQFNNPYVPDGSYVGQNGSQAAGMSVYANQFGTNSLLIETFKNGSFTSYGLISGTAGIINVAIDFDAGNIWLGVNGLWLTGNPSTGTSPTYTFPAGTTMWPGASAQSGNSLSRITNLTALLNFSDGLHYQTPTGFIAGFVYREGFIAQTVPKLRGALAGIADVPNKYYYSWFKDRQN